MSDFPSIKPASVTLTSVTPTRVTRGLNGQEQRQVSLAQYYRITANWQSLTQAQVRQIMGHMAENAGPLTAFYFPLPDYLADITGSGTSATSNSGVVGATSAQITSLGSTPYLKAGDLFRFANDTKLYQCKADVNSSPITFYPQLRTAITTTTNIITQDVKMYVRYANDNQEFTIGTDLYSDLTIEFVEVL